ncbi:MAG: MerR family transcriptional regulator [Desulfovibrio sp.]
MAEKKLLSVAEIARQLDIPESTLHYWKNRFAQFLPSSGQKRQKRFRIEAVDVFQTISTMLGEGYSTTEISDHLAHNVPVNAAVISPQATSPQMQEHVAPAQFQETAVQMAQAMGQEIARTFAEAFAANQSQFTPQPTNQLSEAATAELAELSKSLDEHCGEVEGQVEALIEENADLKLKMDILEKELVRLRKDRRELESFLLDKIKSVTN